MSVYEDEGKGMTFISSFAILPEKRGELKAPRRLAYGDLSVVIPVRNNPHGIRSLLENCQEVFTSEHHPREIIVVDNLSHPPLPLLKSACSRFVSLQATQHGAAEGTPSVNE
jgi:hypothetical protein